MKNKIFPRCIYVFLVLTVFMVFAQFIQAQDIPALKLWAKSDKMIYHKDEEVTIYAYLKNTGEEPLEVNEPAIDRRSYYIEILQPNGKKDKLLSIEGLNLKKIRLDNNKVLKFTAKFTPQMCGEHKVNVIYYGYQDEPITILQLITIYIVK